MLRHGLGCVDADPEYHERQYQQRGLRTAKRREAQLGYALRPQMTLVKPGRSPVIRWDNSGQATRLAAGTIGAYRAETAG